VRRGEEKGGEGMGREGRVEVVFERGEGKGKGGSTYFLRYLLKNVDD
jgi:hypothetical protein